MKVYYVKFNNEQIDLLSAPYHIEETDFSILNGHMKLKIEGSHASIVMLKRKR